MNTTCDTIRRPFSAGADRIADRLVLSALRRQRKRAKAARGREEPGFTTAELVVGCEGYLSRLQIFNALIRLRKRGKIFDWHAYTLPPAADEEPLWMTFSRNPRPPS